MSLNKMKNYQKKQKGFSIIEVMASVFIITFGLIGVLALADQNIRNQRLSKNTLVASQLAQEGLELVRNTRDKNWLLNNDWKFGVGVGTNSDIIQDGSYAIDYSGAIVNVSNVSDQGANLKIDAGGFYWHGIGTNSIFNRMISVVDNGDSINVNATVRWQEGANMRSYSLDTVLYNWR